MVSTKELFTAQQRREYAQFLRSRGKADTARIVEGGGEIPQGSQAEESFKTAFGGTPSQIASGQTQIQLEERGRIARGIAGRRVAEKEFGIVREQPVGRNLEENVAQQSLTPEGERKVQQFIRQKETQAGTSLTPNELRNLYTQQESVRVVRQPTGRSPTDILMSPQDIRETSQPTIEERVSQQSLTPQGRQQVQQFIQKSEQKAGQTLSEDQLRKNYQTEQKFRIGRDITKARREEEYKSRFSFTEEEEREAADILEETGRVSTGAGSLEFQQGDNVGISIGKGVARGGLGLIATLGGGIRTGLFFGKVALKDPERALTFFNPVTTPSGRRQILNSLTEGYKESFKLDPLGTGAEVLTGFLVPLKSFKTPSRIVFSGESVGLISGKTILLKTPKKSLAQSVREAEAVKFRDAADLTTPTIENLKTKQFLKQEDGFYQRYQKALDSIEKETKLIDTLTQEKLTTERQKQLDIKKEPEVTNQFLIDQTEFFKDFKKGFKTFRSEKDVLASLDAERKVARRRLEEIKGIETNVFSQVERAGDFLKKENLFLKEFESFKNLKLDLADEAFKIKKKNVRVEEGLGDLIKSQEKDLELALGKLKDLDPVQKVASDLTEGRRIRGLERQALELDKPQNLLDQERYEENLIKFLKSEPKKSTRVVRPSKKFDIEESLRDKGQSKDFGSGDLKLKTEQFLEQPKTNQLQKSLEDISTLQSKMGRNVRFMRANRLQETRFAWLNSKQIESSFKKFSLQKQKEKPRAKLKDTLQLKTAQAEAVAPREISLSKSALTPAVRRKPASLVVPILRFDTIQPQQSTGQNQLQLQFETTKQKPITTTRTELEITPMSRERTRLGEFTSLEQPTLPKQTSRTRSILREMSKSRSMLLPQKRSQAERGEEEQGYDVYVKRKQLKKGKGSYINRGFTKVNSKPLAKESAFERGASIVDEYTNKSFFLKKSGKASLDSTMASSFLKNKFRTSKKQKNVYVEKDTFAIDSRTEKEGIPYESARQRKRQKALGLISGKTRNKRSLRGLGRLRL